MAQFQAFEFASASAARTGAGPYQELLRRPGFSLGIYQLPAGGEDHQHPHAADEV